MERDTTSRIKIWSNIELDVDFVYPYDIVPLEECDVIMLCDIVSERVYLPRRIYTSEFEDVTSPDEPNNMERALSEILEVTEYLKLHKPIVAFGRYGFILALLMGGAIIDSSAAANSLRYVLHPSGASTRVESGRLNLIMPSSLFISLAITSSRDIAHNYSSNGTSVTLPGIDPVEIGYIPRCNSIFFEAPYSAWQYNVLHNYITTLTSKDFNGFADVQRFSNVSVCPEVLRKKKTIAPPISTERHYNPYGIIKPSKRKEVPTGSIVTSLGATKSTSVNISEALKDVFNKPQAEKKPEVKFDPSQYFVHKVSVDDFNVHVAKTPDIDNAESHEEQIANSEAAIAHEQQRQQQPPPF